MHYTMLLPMLIDILEILKSKKSFLANFLSKSDYFSSRWRKIVWILEWIFGEGFISHVQLVLKYSSHPVFFWLNCYWFFYKFAGLWAGVGDIIEKIIDSRYIDKLSANYRYKKIYSGIIDKLLISSISYPRWIWNHFWKQCTKLSGINYRTSGIGKDVHSFHCDSHFAA